MRNYFRYAPPSEGVTISVIPHSFLCSSGFTEHGVVGGGFMVFGKFAKTDKIPDQVCNLRL